MIAVALCLTLGAAPQFTMHPQLGHSDAVTQVAFSPDGRYLIALQERELRLWTVDGAQLCSKSASGLEKFAHAAFIDATTFALSNGIGIDIYSLGCERRGRLFDGYANHFALRRDKTFWTNDGRSHEVVLRAADGKPLKSCGSKEPAQRPVSRLELSPNQKRLFVNRGVMSPVYNEDCSSADMDDDCNFVDDERVACVSVGTMSVTPADGGRPLNFRKTETSMIDASAATQLIVTANMHEVYIFDANGSKKATIEDPMAADIDGVRFAPDGKSFAMFGKFREPGAAEDATHYGVAWYSVDGALLQRTGARAATVSADISRDGSTLAVLDLNGALALWSHDLRLRTFRPGWGRDRRNPPPTKTGRLVRISPDGRLVAVSRGDGDVDLLTMGGQPITRLESTWSSVTLARDIAFSPDSSLLLIGGLCSNNCNIAAYHTRKQPDRANQKIDTWLDWKARVPLYTNGLAYAADGRLVVATDEDLRLYPAGRGQSKTLSVYSSAGSNRLERVAVGGERIALLTSSQLEVRKLPGGEMEKSVDAAQANIVAISHDGKRVSVGDSTGAIRLYEAPSLKLLRHLADHGDAVTALAFSADGKRLISTALDGKSCISNLETGEHVSLVSAGNEWIVYTPDGVFDASRDGGKLVSMIRDGVAYSVDQFAAEKNRPDVLLQRIGSTDTAAINHFHAQHRRRLRRLGASAGQTSAPPTVSLTANKRTATGVELSFVCETQASALKSYNIFINDVPLFGAQGKPAAGSKAQFTEKIRLTGNSKIEVSCANQEGVESIRALSFSSWEKVPGDLYYLGFGVSKYATPALNLAYAAKDAQDLAETLQRLGGFAKVHTKTLLDQAVTPQSISEQRRFIEQAKEEDTFILFIAGHGMHDTDAEATYYYLTHAADPARLKQTAAPFELIEGLLHGIKPRQKVLLMDTCESGEIDESSEGQVLQAAGQRGLKARSIRGLKKTATGAASGTSATPPAVAPRPFLLQRDRFIYNDLLRRSGAIVFSSSRGGEFSYESPAIENGYFTEALMTALTTGVADANNDDVVSSDELRSYVAKNVSEATRGMQNPTVDRDNLAMKLAFAKKGCNALGAGDSLWACALLALLARRQRR